MFDKLVIIGVGLIGGSVALIARHAGLARRIVGVGCDGDAMPDALRLGVIDAVEPTATAVRNADCVFLAMPVGQMTEVMRAIAPHLPAHAVVTDVGSTKGDIVAAARAHMGNALPRFVPGHPIAGAEKSGVLAARSDLFKGKNVVLTPVAETSAAATQSIAEFWQACGARVSEMPHQTHDLVFATVSHLPHLLAFALVEEIANRPDADLMFGFAASGFRDFSRIAGSSPEMWRDICLANRPAMLQALSAYQRQLARIHDLIDTGRGDELASIFEHARTARITWARTHNKTDGNT